MLQSRFSENILLLQFWRVNCYGYVSFFVKLGYTNLSSIALQYLRYLTSPYNQPHYLISPRKQLHDIKTGHITTMEQQKARSRQRNGLGITLVGRLAHIQCKHVFAMLGPNTLHAVLPKLGICFLQKNLYVVICLNCKKQCTLETNIIYNQLIRAAMAPPCEPRYVGDWPCILYCFFRKHFFEGHSLTKQSIVVQENLHCQVR